MTNQQADVSIENIAFHLAVLKKYFKITTCLRASMKCYCLRPSLTELRTPVGCTDYIFD